jgi:hypothetical protein
MVEATLSAAAFGSQPGCWPLPTATTPHQRWLRAVAAGGQGRYGSAHGDLEALLRSVPAGRLASLGHSTQGSFLRQLGWHALARRWDGRALMLAGGDLEARADALIGLAADALGVGRFAAATTLLNQVERFAGAAAHRLAVRRSWVAAELAMATGAGSTAVRHAEAAVELAAEPLCEPAAGAGSERHRVKSQLVLAAALCSSGDLDRARTVGDAAFEAAGRLGLVPLRWALACLLVDIGSTSHPTSELQALRDSCADRVRHAGGTWARATA